MRIILVFLFIYAAVCSPKSDVSFKKHLNKLSEVRHPMYNEGREWLDARYYVKKTMENNGVTSIIEQKFTTEIGSYAGSVKQVEGVNIIGIAKGIKQSGPVIIIGVDYDTPIDANPIKNNGGGVAIMLETTKLFENLLKSSPNKLKYTVIFVAFDLNTKEYSTSGTGHTGSYHFVNTWLPQFLKDNKASLGGALILDSVTTVNYAVDTQFLPSGFDAAFPDAYEKIMRDGKKGNFLGIVSTSNQTKNPVRQEFVNNFQRDRMLRPYYLQEMELHLSVEAATSDVVRMIDHQAHFHFWTYNEEKYPAFLIFDTDKARNEPNSECTLKCDSKIFLDDERNRFMTNTVNTLIRVLESLQMAEIEVPEIPDSADKSMPSFITEVLIFFVAYKMR